MVAPSAGELITTSVAEVGVGAGGLLEEVPAVELLPLELFPALELDAVPDVEVELEFVAPVPDPPLLLAFGEPAADTFVLVELSTDLL